MSSVGRNTTRTKSPAYLSTISYRSNLRGVLQVAETVLIVEDEAIIRFAIADYLEESGFDVLLAENALQALEILASHPNIAALFTDVRMPGRLDGLDLAKWTIENKPEIPVIVASGDAAKHGAINQLRLAHFFTKPYRYEALVRAIRQAIDVARGSGPTVNASGV